MTQSDLTVNHNDDFYEKIVLDFLPSITKKRDPSLITVKGIDERQQIVAIVAHSPTIYGVRFSAFLIYDGNISNRKSNGIILIARFPISSDFTPPFSYLGVGATCGDLVKDLKKVERNQRTPIHFGIFYGRFLSRQDLVTLNQLSTDPHAFILWSKQMERLETHVANENLNFPLPCSDDFSTSVIQFAKRYRRPPIIGRVLGDVVYDEAKTGHPITIDIFQKKVPLFEPTKENSHSFQVIGCQPWGAVEIKESVNGTNGITQFRIGDGKKLWMPEKNIFGDIDVLQKLLKKIQNDQETRSFKNVTDFTGREKLYKRSGYFFCANHSFDRYLEEKRRFISQDAFNVGMFLEGLLSRGRFDLPNATKKMVEDLVDKDPLPNITINDITLPAGKQKLVVFKSIRTEYIVAVISEKQRIRPFSEYFVLEGVKGIEKKKVLKILEKPSANKEFSR